MSLLSGVTKGRIEKPYLVLIHGAPGVGKSTFAADAPNPIFLGTEDGTSSLDVARFPTIGTFKQVRLALTELLTSKHDYKTLVIDSLDWLEPLVFAEVCQESNAKSIEDASGGWGKGYVAALGKWRELIEHLNALRSEKKMNVILIAHSQVKKFDDIQENRTYDRWTLKLNDKASSLFVEFVDTCLFASFEVHTRVDENKKVRAYSEGRRIALSSWRPQFVAKNRNNLPHSFALDWITFDDLCKANKPADADALKGQIAEMLMLVDGPTAETVKSHVKKLGDDAVGLSKVLNRLQTIANHKTV